MAFFLSLRASRRIGRAVRLRENGRHEEAMAAYARALSLMDRVSVGHSEEPWVVSSSAAALLGFAQSAAHLGRDAEVRTALTHWKARYERWRTDGALPPSFEPLQRLYEQLQQTG